MIKDKDDQMAQTKNTRNRYQMMVATNALSCQVDQAQWFQFVILS